MFCPLYITDGAIQDVRMKCPRTGAELKEVVIDGIRIDYSEESGGVWLDNFELQKFDEAHESAGEKLAELTKRSKNGSVDLSKRLNCPKDPVFVMARRYYSPKAEVEIDECPMCGGIWLDAGELSRIRELFPSEEDLRKANDDFASAVFRDSGLDELRRESEAGREKTQRLANFLRWITPSHYLK